MQVPESMVGSGAHAAFCSSDVNVLIIVDSGTVQNRYLAESLGQSDLHAVVGPRWIVMTQHAEQLAGPLGGKVEKYATGSGGDAFGA